MLFKCVVIGDILLLLLCFYKDNFCRKGKIIGQSRSVLTTGTYLRGRDFKIAIQWE